VNLRLLVAAPLLLACAGCGASPGDGRIDAGNAKHVVVERLSGSRRPSAAPRTRGGALTLAAPNRKWRLEARPGTVRLVDARTGATLDVLAVDRSQPLALAWTRDSKTFAVAGVDGVATVWEEFRHRTFELHASRRTPVRALAFSPDGALLAEGQATVVRIWDLARRREVAAPRTPAVSTWLRFAGDGRRIVGGDPPWQLRLPR
jgi:WD40 repeat protein